MVGIGLVGPELVGNIVEVVGFVEWLGFGGQCFCYVLVRGG